MTSQPTGDEPVEFGRYRYLLMAASGLTFLLIILGGTVCMTDSTLGCPDWPGCFGQIVPPLQVNAIIEFSHRFVAALAGATILAAAIAGQSRFKTIKWVRRVWVVTVVLLLAVVVFGAFAVLTGLSRGVAAVDVGSALTVLALVLAMTSLVFTGRSSGRISFAHPFTRLGLVTLVATFAVLVSSVLVAPAGSIIRCLGWPMFQVTPFTASTIEWAQLTRGVIAGIAAFLGLVVFIQAWQSLQQQREIYLAALVMGISLVVEFGLGFLITSGGTSYLILIPYVVAAASHWSALVVMVALSSQRLATNS